MFVAFIITTFLKDDIEPCFHKKYYDSEDEESDDDEVEIEDNVLVAPAAAPAVKEENEVQIISTESESCDDSVELTQNILDNAIINILLKAKKGKTAKEILMKIREILPSITKHDVNSRLYTFKNKKLVAKDKSSVPLWISS